MVRVLVGIGGLLLVGSRRRRGSENGIRLLLLLLLVGGRRRRKIGKRFYLLLKGIFLHGKGILGLVRWSW